MLDNEENIADEAEIESFLAAPPEQSSRAIGSDPAEIASPDEVDEWLKEEKYGSAGQQLITGLEGAASAATFGLSTGIERALGVDPEDIRARREVNPIAHGAGQVGGLIGSALIPGLGAASAGKALLGAGQGAARLAGLGAAESIAGKIAAAGIAAGTENVLFQAGDEISKMLSSDPAQSVETAAANIGAAAIVGGVVGGGIGAVSPLWKATIGKEVGGFIDNFKRGASDSSLEAAAGVPAGDETIIGGMKKLKGNAKEIAEAAEELGAPLLESQISASKHIQDIDSMLMQSPTPVGVARQQMMQQGIDAAENTVKGVLGDAASVSDAELGNSLRGGIRGRLEAEYAPIQKLYQIVEQSTPHIPVSPNATKQIARNILNLEEATLSKSGPGAALAKRVARDMPGLDSVDKIKRYKTNLYDELSPAASRQEKNVVNAIAEKLSRLERATIERQAEKIAAETQDQALKQEVLSLLSQRQAADAGYKKLMEHAGDLAQGLGKKRIRGFSQFMEFLDDLTPEQISSRLFAKKNSEFLTMFAERYPEQAQAMFAQQKALIREAATKDGIVNTRTVLKKVDDLPPEVQRLMFSADELKKLNAAKTYLEAIPGNINPSGTSKAEAYRRFFTNPVSTAVESARDYGLGKLMQSLVSKGDEAAFYRSVFPAVAEAVAKGETSPSALKSAVDYGMNVVRGERAIYRGTRALFRSTREVLPSKKSEVSDLERNRLDKKIDEIQKNPEEMLAIGGETAHYLPSHAAALSATAGRVVQFLASVKPRPKKLAPLDPELPPSKSEMAIYHRYVALAQRPLSVLEHVRDGTLLPNDVHALNQMYPALYQKLRSRVSQEMISFTGEGKSIPYSMRQSLSLFLGEPLESSLKPENLQAAQSVFAAQRQARAGGDTGPGPVKKGTRGLEKVAGQYQTSEQAAISRRLKG